MHGKGKFTERFRSKNKPPKTTSKAERIPRATVWFTRIYDSQLDVLLSLGPVACVLYVVLAREYRRHYSKPFTLRVDAFMTLEGLNRRNLRQALFKLETYGLISAQQNPSRPPIIKVVS